MICPNRKDGKCHIFEGNCGEQPSDGMLERCGSPPIWPPFAARLKAVKAEGEIGVGDTAAREVARLGLEEFQTAYGIRFGPSCGCMAKEWGEEARATWNEKWRYEITSHIADQR